MLWQTQPEAEKLAHQGIVDPPSAISRTQIPVFSLGLPGSKVVGFDLKLKSSSVLLMHICRLWCSLNLLETYLLSPIILGNAELPWNSRLQFSGTSYSWVDPWLIHWDLSMPSSTSRAAGNAFRGGAGLQRD